MNWGNLRQAWRYTVLLLIFESATGIGKAYAENEYLMYI